MDNYFIDSIADDTELDFTKYKIVEPNEYGAVLMKVGSLRYNAKKKSYANTIFKKIYGKDNNRCIIYMCNRRFVCTCCFYLVCVE